MLYEGIEWVVADIACALAGCVSVGIHCTFDINSAKHVFQKANIELLLCAGDKVFEADAGGNARLIFFQ
jgi:long-subunit acyl-CoA synthetase (AMP-forming)